MSFAAVGQVLRATPAKQFFINNKKAFKSLQEVSSLSIIFILIYANIYIKYSYIEYAVPTNSII